MKVDISLQTEMRNKVPIIFFFRYMVHPDAKRWFVNSNFHKTDFLAEFLNDAMTYAMVS